jgi:epsin
MDFNSLKDKVSNLSLYDLKAGVRQVQNGMRQKTAWPRWCWSWVAVMNYTEMEAKVREATNNEPWGASAISVPGQLLTLSGASSTLMQEIANATFN